MIRPRRARIVINDGLAKAGRLTQAHRAADGRLEDFARKGTSQFGQHLVGEVGADIEHRGQDPRGSPSWD